jgi:hypothetical protein
MTVHVFGIRHHGPGSARSLVAALTALQPDALLVEGPPDAAPVLPLLADPTMRPPVALLVYRPDRPQAAASYPLAEYSPEWQALRYGLAAGIAVRFMDLPQAHLLADAPDATDDQLPAVAAPVPEALDTEEMAGEAADAAPADTAAADEALALRRDPLCWLAQAAGEEDGERWWERMVEERRDSAGLFAGILEAMTALRAASPPPDDPREMEREARREAFMRQTIRAAQRAGFARIAVVCGAWHAPALVDLPPASADAAVLRWLPKVAVAATWMPWTDSRLTVASGYGAGVVSPGWYAHLWRHPEATAVHWLARVAGLLRAHDLSAAPAQVIEAVRLADALAALRDRAQPGLAELTEATRAVLCYGSDAPLALIHRRLIVGDGIGAVPAETPMTPLQTDVAQAQRRLRLPPAAAERTLDLDLRQPTDLARSHLLHRLSLVGVAWGELGRRDGAAGTFHEIWQLHWRPELTIALIEASRWGTTLPEAATARARDLADTAPDLAALTALVEQTLLADLPDAIQAVLARLQAATAVTGDVGHLMEALPPLAQVARYGNVRGTDAASVGTVIDGLVARICIGLPGACASLDDDAAAAMLQRLLAVDAALALLQRDDHRAAWWAVLVRLADHDTLHGLLAGRCTRLLLDAGRVTAGEAARRLSLALSPAGAPARMAAWIEGFLGDSGQLLLLDEALWTVLDDWLTALPADAFTSVLPLLRRTFARFAAPERRQLGERVRAGQPRSTLGAAVADAFDAARADAVLPLLAQMLGLSGAREEQRS